MTDEEPNMPLTKDLIKNSWPANTAHTETNTEEEYEIVRCPNKFDCRESYIEHSDDNRTADDVYFVTRNDNDVGYQLKIADLWRLWRGIFAKTSSEIGRCPCRSAHVVYPRQTTEAMQSKV